MVNPIILIGGGTGVGTSRLSFEVSKLLSIPSVTSTDAIREVIRNVINPSVSPPLFASTYKIGKTINYEYKHDDLQKSEILRGFKNQCLSVWAGIEAIIKRSVTEESPCIIEGVHIRSGYIADTDFYESIKDRLLEVTVYLKDESTHKHRFDLRGLESPERPTNKYLQNFQEIRWIHDYLLERAKINNILLVENSQSIDVARTQIISQYLKKFNI